ncbi:3'-5' exonuclease [Bradyrhizobium diazoefficiens]
MRDEEDMAALLESTGRYRVLRRLAPRAAYHAPDGTPTRRAVFIDLETTGLDPVADEIVEIAMVPFDYSDDGRIFAVHESFARFRDPGRPIPPEVSAMTGITDAMVAGAAIEPAEIEAFLGDTAALVVAHNCSFDRRFAERFCPAFAHLPWACSWAEIPWREEGFVDGTKLVHLAAACGFFHEGHRAVHDCLAGIELLSRPLPRSGQRALAVLLSSARAPRWRVRAAGAPFELRESLKRRGYRLGSRRARRAARMVRRPARKRPRGRERLPPPRDLPAGRSRSRSAPSRRLRPLLRSLLIRLAIGPGGAIGGRVLKDSKVVSSGAAFRRAGVPVGRSSPKIRSDLTRGRTR